MLTMAVMGWWLAKACIQPGMVDTGTYALETKVSGNTRNDRLCAACGLPANRPSATKSQQKAKPNSAHMPKRLERGAGAVVDAEADGEADAGGDGQAQCRERGVGPHVGVDDREARDGEAAQPVHQTRGRGRRRCRPTRPCR